MKIKKFIAFGLSLAIAVSGLTFAPKKTEEVKAASNYTLVWSDEFDGTSLNTATWNYEIGNGDWGWGNGEKQYYTRRTENVEVSDGTLKIKALKESYGGQSYTSGRITTKGKQEFKYGKIEARMKLPSFTGSWPAFWMLGANQSSVGWPKCGEIDIMEAINTENNTHGAIHWYNDSTGYQNDGSSSSAGNLPSGYSRTEWHTYGIEWDEERIRWYIDDQVFFSQNIFATHMSEFRQKQFIILNLAIGGQWPGYTIDNTAFPDESVMEVDYVRVYQQVEEPETTTKFEGETVVSYETVDSVAVNTNTFGTYFGGNTSWGGTATGTASDSTNTGITLHADSLGDNLWMIQASLLKLRYVPGNTYTYKCTITSDITKSVRVKVVGEGDDYIFSQDDITVQAGVPYYYEKQVTIPADYNFEGRLDLYFGLGKNHFVNENIGSDTAMNITISDASFVTEEKVITYIPKETTAATNNVINREEVTTKVEETTKVTYKKPGKPKIKKIIKKKKSFTIVVKKVKKIDGYQIRYATNKKFKKYKNKNTFYLRTTVRKLKSKKKYYVKVRSYYLNDDGIRVYSKFSKVKKVKTK